MHATRYYAQGIPIRLPPVRSQVPSTWAPPLAKYVPTVLCTCSMYTPPGRTSMLLGQVARAGDSDAAALHTQHHSRQAGSSAHAKYFRERCVCVWVRAWLGRGNRYGGPAAWPGLPASRPSRAHPSGSRTRPRGDWRRQTYMPVQPRRRICTYIVYPLCVAYGVLLRRMCMVLVHTE